MATHPADVLLARAHAHLSEARLPQAVGAFRAAVGVAGTCPTLVPAHLGLATALSALGRREEAVEGLAAAAGAAAERDEHGDALRLWTEALAIDPSRTELHLDLAMAEQALGRHADAVARLETLADRCMDEGRFDDAAELLRCLSQWGGDEEAAPSAPSTPTSAPALELVPRHAALITGDTVIARNPLLPALDVLPALAKPVVTLQGDEVTRVDAPVMMVPAVAAADHAPEQDDVESRITVVHGGATRSQPARPQPATHRPALRPVPAGSEVVERLKARAGLGRAGASPRRASVRPTAPISIRSRERFTAQDEDVTRYFRRPQGLDAAS